MTDTEDILKIGLAEDIVPVSLMSFDRQKLPLLAEKLDDLGISLKAHIKNGIHAAIFENTLGDAVRIEQLNNKVSAAKTIDCSIVFQTPLEIELQDLDIRIRLYIRGRDEDNGRKPDIEDVMRTVSVVHAAGKLDNLRDMGESQLKFAFNPATQDLVRYPDGRAVGFVVDANSAVDDLTIITGGSASDILKKRFNWNDEQLIAELIKVRGDNPDRFLEASDAQYTILDTFGERYKPVPTAISNATGAEVILRPRGTTR